MKQTKIDRILLDKRFLILMALVLTVMELSTIIGVKKNCEETTFEFECRSFNLDTTYALCIPSNTNEDMCSGLTEYQCQDLCGFYSSSKDQDYSMKDWRSQSGEHKILE